MKACISRSNASLHHNQSNNSYKRYNASGMGARSDKAAWATFVSSGANAADSFERRVALRLFAKKIGLRPQDLQTPANFPGVESVPVNVSGIFTSFQAKFNAAGKTPWSDFRQAIRTAVAKKEADYYKLDRVVMYTNGSPGAGTGAHPQTASQKKIDDIARASGIGIEWMFGPQILDALREIPDMWCLFDPEFPDLRQPTSVNDLFQAVNTGFVGRQDQLDELHNFIESDAPFLWWVLSGRAGSGKTRLLTEFAKLIGPEWSMAWVGATTRLFEHKHMTGPLVLVVDGVHSYGPSELRNLLEAFSDQSPGYPLRLILVERDAAPLEQWLTGGVTNKSAMTRFSEPLELAPLQAASWERLVRDVANSRGTDGDDLLLHYPPGQGTSPLELLIQTQVSAGSELKSSIRKLLADQRAHHYPAADEETVDLAAAATIVRSFDWEALANSSVYQELGQGIANSSERTQNLCSILGYGPDSKSSNELLGITPDLLGELFVLDRWKQQSLLPMPRSLDIALAIGGAGAVIDFFFRTSLDYASHPSLEKLTGQEPADPTYARTWHLAQAATIPHVYMGGAIGLAEELLKQLAEVEPVLAFHALVQLLLANSNLHGTPGISQLSDLDDPAIDLYLRLPGVSAQDVDGIVLADQLSGWLISGMEQLAFTPPFLQSLTTSILTSEVTHAKAKGGDLERFKRAVAFIRRYREHPVVDTTTYGRMLEVALISIQHLAPRGDEWAEQANELFTEIQEHDPELAAKDSAAIIVRVWGDSEGAAALMESLYLEGNQSGEWRVFLAALTNYTGRLGPGSVQAQVCTNWILELASSADLDSRNSNTVQGAAGNCYGKISEEAEDQLFNAMLDLLLRQPVAVGAGDATRRTLEKLANKGTEALLVGDWAGFKAVIESLTSANMRDRADTSWQINSVFASLAKAELSDGDFGQAWPIIGGHRHLLPANQLGHHVTNWYGLIIRAKSYGGARHRAILELAPEDGTAHNLAQTLDSVGPIAFEEE